MTTDAPPDQPEEIPGASAVAADEPREALPQTVHSDRLLWIGAGVALVVHALPFLNWSQNPDPLGEGVLTEAIAVELVDKAALEGRDQTPPAPPAAAATQPQPQQQQQQQQQQSPAQRPQRAQQAVPPAPPPSPPAKRAEPAPEPPKPEPQSKSLPAFEGESARAQPKEKEPDKPQPAAKEEATAKPPQRPTPPPRPAAEARAPAQATPPSAKPSAPRAPSSPALAKSGEVTQFAKDVVAALAKAKPAAPRNKENKPIKGKVQVTVVVAPGGGIRFAKVTGPSGNDDLDTLALEAAKKAAVPSPPPDVTTDDLFYDVEYNFQ